MCIQTGHQIPIRIALRRNRIMACWNDEFISDCNRYRKAPVSMEWPSTLWQLYKSRDAISHSFTFSTKEGLLQALVLTDMSIEIDTERTGYKERGLSYRER